MFWCSGARNLLRSSSKPNDGLWLNCATYSLPQHFFFLFLTCSPVPIIPSYLYNLDESADVALRNDSLSQKGPEGSFHTIVSLYDNSIRLSSSNFTTRPADPVPPTLVVTKLQQNSSDCPQSSSRLLNENVKVGMLFASKATVQLVTNPFIGPLTNRWAFTSFSSWSRVVYLFFVNFSENTEGTSFSLMVTKKDK